MSGRLEAAVQGYFELATSLAERWRQHLDEVQARVERDDYTANQAVADFTQTAALAAECWTLLASEAVDAVTTIAAPRPDRDIVESEPFTTSIPGARLTVEGPLVNVQKTDELRADAVWCEPEQLSPGQNTFRVCVDAALHDAGLYEGRVRAEAGGASEYVNVEVLVA
jgi:hypothetical protein